MKNVKLSKTAKINYKRRRFVAEQYNLTRRENKKRLKKKKVRFAIPTWKVKRISQIVNTKPKAKNKRLSKPKQKIIIKKRKTRIQ